MFTQFYLCRARRNAELRRQETLIQKEAMEAENKRPTPLKRQDIESYLREELESFPSILDRAA